MGSLEKIDDKNFVIKIKTANITSSRPCVYFSHLDCSWRLSYDEYNDGKRSYKVKCTGSDSDLWNMDTNITFNFFKQDGTKGITRLTNYSFNSSTKYKECELNVSTGLPIADFDEVFPDAEVHVKINSVTGFQREPRHSNFEKDEHLSDVALVVEGKKLHVNKAVLATFSPVFRAMFFTGFRESLAEEVVIKDVKYDDFLNFLQVMHDAFSKVCEENVQNLLVLADRYDVAVVMEKCDNYFVSLYIDSTDHEKLTLAETYQLPKLHKKCIDAIKKEEKYQKSLRKSVGSKKRKLDEPNDSKTEEKVKPITVIQRNTYMEFDKKDNQLSNFAFVFEGKKLYVNKAVLATFSSVFRDMFFSEFKQSTDNEMIINDVNCDEFEQFLQAIYTAYSTNDENIENVLALSDRYKVNIVMDKCESYLLFTDDVCNADKLRLAETYSFPKLHKEVMDSIDCMEDLTAVCVDKDQFGPLTSKIVIEKLVEFEDYREYKESKYRRW